MSSPPDSLAQTGLSFLVITTPEGSRKVPLTAETLLLGRHPTCDIVIEETVVSGRHARLERRLEGYEIIDLHSSNGLVYDGQRVQQHNLCNGDVLNIGNRVTLGYQVVIPDQPATRQNGQGDSGKTILLGDDPLPLASTQPAILDLRGRQALTIGRDPQNELVIDHPTVSRCHSRVERKDGSFVITDLGSTNGTFVNGKQIAAPFILRTGDTIRIGSHLLVLNIDETLVQTNEVGNLRLDALNLTKLVKSGAKVLNGVSVSIMPREFVAVLGPSGSGKSTLLDALNGLRPATGGTVMVNGVDLYRNFNAYHSEIGYVPQKNIIHEELTVAQSLDFAAQLRMPADTRPQERQQRITEVLAELGLTQRRDVPVKNLSGGQQRRVCIGVELLTKPSLFFLDEATSGLDPGTETDMMELLRQLADQGRTILLITHATQNVALCDLVIYMAEGGRVAYFGPPEELVPYFLENFAECLAPFQIRDITGIYRALDREKNPQAPTAMQLQETYLASPQYRQYVLERQQSLQEMVKPKTSGLRPKIPQKRVMNRGISPWRQFLILLRRNIAILQQDVGSFGLILLTPVLLGMLDFIAWDRNIFNTDTGNAAQGMTMLFVSALIAVLIGELTTMRDLVKEVEVYRRERMVGLQLIPYIASKVSLALIFAAYQGAVFLLVKKLAVDIPGGWDVVGQMYFTFALATFGGMVMGLLVSALAPNQNMAPLLSILLLVPMIIFSGGIQPVSGMGGGAKLLSQVSVIRWPYEALVSLSGMGRDLIQDPCWQKDGEARKALTTAELQTCQCLGANVFRQCEFPGIRSRYNSAVDELEPVKPTKPADPGDVPDDPAAFATFRDTLRAYQDQMKTYQDQITAWQDKFTDWQQRRSRSINEAEGLLDTFRKDHGSLFAANVVASWRHLGLLILGMLIAVPFLQKRRDMV
ncbi:ABC transporter ATP-binding protein [Gloeomargarita lithophora Alchichica-D10]|uniref:ABC transporter ATP-binding protein n=1 Tax=Gloeomargarita lithophora Alchichica-D10 TaxID=1188229 RepID=A0A1J0AFS1_9CYAN|nr:FHA domain-containing protein [Gloeomargarita lithophora]APB34788.1 ABC transporter ATP-binding protein [Gloeomargarita lithophora Alchichica-D10]